MQLFLHISLCFNNLLAFLDSPSQSVGPMFPHDLRALARGTVYAHSEWSNGNILVRLTVYGKYGFSFTSPHAIMTCLPMFLHDLKALARGSVRPQVMIKREYLATFW